MAAAAARAAAIVASDAELAKLLQRQEEHEAAKRRQQQSSGGSGSGGGAGAAAGVGAGEKRIIGVTGTNLASSSSSALISLSPSLRTDPDIISILQSEVSALLSSSPHPDLHRLFRLYNAALFGGALDSVEVVWSTRMKLCAGTCSFKPQSGHCRIGLSAPILQYRPQRDTLETLLHEMIHALLFVGPLRLRDRDDHGPVFCAHMHRLNSALGLSISVYHQFHDEVARLRTHVWRCGGPCANRPPYFGKCSRSSNRPPGPRDLWWQRHQATCGGVFHKVSEPEPSPVEKRRAENKLKREDARVAREKEEKMQRHIGWTSGGSLTLETEAATAAAASASASAGAAAAAAAATAVPQGKIRWTVPTESPVKGQRKRKTRVPAGTAASAAAAAAPSSSLLTWLPPVPSLRPLPAGFSAAGFATGSAPAAARNHGGEFDDYDCDDDVVDLTSDHAFTSSYSAGFGAGGAAAAPSATGAAAAAGSSASAGSSPASTPRSAKSGGKGSGSPSKANKRPRNGAAAPAAPLDPAQTSIESFVRVLGGGGSSGVGAAAKPPALTPTRIPPTTPAKSEVPKRAGSAASSSSSSFSSGAAAAAVRSGSASGPGMAADSSFVGSPAALPDGRSAGRLRAVDMLSARIDAQKQAQSAAAATASRTASASTAAASSTLAVPSAAAAPVAAAATAAAAASLSSFRSTGASGSESSPSGAPLHSSQASALSSASSSSSVPSSSLSSRAPVACAAAASSLLPSPMELDCSDDDHDGGGAGARFPMQSGAAESLDEDARRAVERAETEALEEEFAHTDDLHLG